MAKKFFMAVLPVLYGLALVFQFFYRRDLVIPWPPALRMAVEIGAVSTLLVAGFGAGGLIFSRILKSKPSDALERLTALGLGLVALSFTGFLFAAAHVLYNWVIFPVLSVLFFYGLRLIVRLEIKPDPKEKLFRLSLAPLVLILVLFLGYTLVSALAPPQSWDEQVYHLLLPKLYLAHHGFRKVDLIYASFPQNQEMIYTLLMGVADTVAAHIFHFSCGLLSLVLLWHLGKKIFGSSRAGLWAAVLFAVSGTYAYEASSSYIELGLSLLVLLSITAALKFRETQSLRWLLVCAIFSGGAVATKYTAIGPMLATGILVLAWSRKWKAPKTALYFAVALGFLIPWLMKNLVLTLNPFYPFLTNILGGVGWNETLHQRYVSSLMLEGMGRKWLDYIALFPRLFLYGRQHSLWFDARFNVLLLALSPLYFLLVRDRRNLWIWLWFAVAFAAWAAGPQHGRFLLPAIAVLALISGAAFDRLLKLLPGWGMAAAFAAAIAISAAWMPAGFWDSRTEFKFLSGELDTEQYLIANRDRIGLVRINELMAINQVAPKDAKVFMIWENRGLYLECEYSADSAFEASYAKQLITDLGRPDRLYVWLKANGFDYIYNARLPAWDSYELLPAETREEYARAYAIYREFAGQYGELVFRRNGELVKLK